MIKICTIVAVSANGTIGKDNGIPWYIPDDLKRFKAITMGYPTIMGRLTYESIGKALPGRPAIVISSVLEQLPDAIVVSTLEDAVTKAKELAADLNLDKVFIIGGSRVYVDCIDITDELYLTVIHKYVEGDSQFPFIVNGMFKHDDFELTDKEPIDFHTQGCGTIDALAYSYQLFERK